MQSIKLLTERHLLSRSTESNWYLAFLKILLSFVRSIGHLGFLFGSNYEFIYPLAQNLNFILSNLWLLFISSRLKISRFYWEFYKLRIGKVEVGCRYDICFSIITQFVNNTYDMLHFSVYWKSLAFIETFLGMDVVYFVFFILFLHVLFNAKISLTVINVTYPSTTIYP